MADKSFLDKLYFIDQHIYNCPFCNRRHVAYSVMVKSSFDWSEDKKCYIYFVRCHSCENTSMHLTYDNIPLEQWKRTGDVYHYRFRDDFEKIDELDNVFFYSVPTSFYVLDNRIPKILRELMTEAEGCQKSNFLTGASACARKLVYELGVLQKAKGANYEDRIKSLKELNPVLDPTLFDTLLTIQQITSEKVHEESYDGWQSKHLRLILSILSEIFREIYVVPAVREEKRNEILKLKETVLGSKKPKADL